MSRPLHKYTIVHYEGFYASGDFDGSEECVAIISASTPEQAVEAYCFEQQVHIDVYTPVGDRIWREWYEAEEVDE